MEHLEDSVFNEGSSGVIDAIRFLEAVTGMLSDSDAGGMRVTVKWDGAPAVFAGINPENGKFFVGTKSVFNKVTPKINYTNADIDANHSGQLAEKLKTALQYMPKLGIKDVLQGDLLFTDDVSPSKIDGEIYYTFTPNTITYAVPVASKMGKVINKSKMGIVFHTKYTGKTMKEMKASFNPNVSSLKSTPDVYYSDADIEDFSGIMLTSDESKNITSKINQCKGLLKKSGKVIDIIAKEYGDDVKIFMNTLVRQGSTRGAVDVFIKHMSDRFDKEIEKASDRVKPKREAKKNEFMKKVRDKTSALKAAFELSSALTDAKMPLIRKLESIKSMGTFIKTNNGYRVTAPEGFVAVDLDGKALKLVDRLEFSRANFTVSKNWDKT
tara:strand:+ start:2073 stop:3218 length:1146 start_codon:yes stop_codon:yes gene_type:complete